MPGLSWDSRIQWTSDGKIGNCDGAMYGQMDGTANGFAPPPPQPTPVPPTPTPVPPTVPTDRGTLRLTPATGPSGQYTAVYGTDFEPGETVEIRWGSESGPVIGRMTVRNDRTFLGRITTRPGTPGSTRVYAVGTRSLYRTYAWYQITSSAPTMSLRSSSNQTQSGARITLSGSGYQPNEMVDIRWISQSGTLLSSVQASSSGTFSRAIVVPDAPNKNYQIFATGRTSKRYASVVHQVRNYARTGSSFVTPISGNSGIVVGVNGRGYGANERVEIRWGSLNGKVLGYVTTNADGTYWGRVTIPAAAAGSHYIVAVGTSTYRYSSATYTVTANTTVATLNVSHKNVQPGWTISFSGSGMVPGQQVELRWNGPGGPLLGRVTVRWDGSYSGRVTIPLNATRGANRLYAISPSRFTSAQLNVGTVTASALTAATTLKTAPTPTVTPTATPEMIGTPGATPQVEIPATPVASSDAPVGTPEVVQPEIPVGTPAGEQPEIPVGTPGAEEPTEIPTEVPAGTPTEAPTEAPIVAPTVEPTVEPTPAPALYPETLVITDQYQVPVIDVCIEATNLTTGEIVKACDVTDWQVTDPARDDLRDGRVRILPGIEAGQYRIEVKNLPADIPVPEPQVVYLDGTDAIDVTLLVWRPEPTPEPTAVPVEIPTEEPVPTAVPTEPPVEPQGTDIVVPGTPEPTG